MLILFDSRTGNVRRFVKKLDRECIQIQEEMIVEEPFVLITYTTGFGQVPKKVNDFLMHNHKFLMGVAASGNRNWGVNFTKSAVIISQQYNVPIIHRFEMAGTKKDVEIFLERVQELETHRIKQ